MQPKQSKSGYVQDVVFDSAYRASQRPALLSFIAASGGFAAPDPASSYSYLELGCSTGATLNGLAAANPQARFHGVDFNDDHIEMAKSAAIRAGLANVEYTQADFVNLAARDLPSFDYISTYGTYSWLDPAAEAAVHDILDKRLNPDGVFLVDYLSLPGKAPVAPMWHLMRSVSDTDGRTQSTERAEEGLRFLKQLSGSKAKFFTENPHAQKVLEYWEHSTKQDRSSVRQLAHNALTENWSPKFFRDLAGTLGAYGIGFAGAAELRMNDAELALPGSLRPAAGGERDRLQLESVKDFYHYTQQRQDVFVRAGERVDDGSALLGSDLALSFIWTRQAPAWNFRDPEGIQLQQGRETYAAGLDVVSNGAVSIKDLAARLGAAGHAQPDIVLALGRMLSGSEPMLLVSPPEDTDALTGPEVQAANGFNRMAVEDYAGKSGVLYLASPCSGGCVSLPPLISAVVAAMTNHGRTDISPDQASAYVRKLPGHFATGKGQQIAASRITREMIAPSCKLAAEVVIPGLVRLKALSPAR